MEVRLLRYYLTVVREENITRAADILHMTQPTLSRQMTQLEEEIGEQLFIRGKHLTLTDAGVMLRHRAEEIVQLMDKMEEEFRERNEIGGQISIGCGGQRSVSFVLKKLSEFQTIYPRVKYRIYTNNADNIKDHLERGLLDFGVLLEPVDISKYDYIRLKGKDRWGILMPANSELSFKEYVTKEDLLGLPLMVTDRQILQKEIKHWFGEELERLNIVGTYNIITNVVSIVATSGVYALTIDGAVELYDENRLKFRALSPKLEMTSVLAWKKFNPGFGAVGKFLEYVKGGVEADDVARVSEK